MRKEALGIGIGAALIIALFIGRAITEDLSGRYWEIRKMQKNFRDMPKQLGGWTAIDSGDLELEVFKVLGAADAEERLYQNQSGKKINYHASVFEDFFVTPNHTPYQCYPAQGWKLLNETPVEIPLSDGTTFKPTLITFEKDGGKVYVIFWFQFGDEIVVNGEQQRKALECYRSDGKWPSMFKAMLHLSVESPYEDEEAMKELAAHIYEYTRTLQDGGKAKPSQATVPNQD